MNTDARYRDLVTPLDVGGQGLTPEEARVLLAIEEEENALLDLAAVVGRRRFRAEGRVERLRVLTEKASALHEAARLRHAARRRLAA